MGLIRLENKKIKSIYTILKSLIITSIRESRILFEKNLPIDNCMVRLLTIDGSGMMVMVKDKDVYHSCNRFHLINKYLSIP